MRIQLEWSRMEETENWENAKGNKYVVFVVFIKNGVELN